MTTRVSAPDRVHLPALRMLFYLDYENHLGAGDETAHFASSPGILPLVGLTRRAGFEVVLVTSRDDLLRHLREERVDVLGISSMQRVLHFAVEVALEVRKLHPDLILMIGGNSIDPYACDLAAGLFDVVVIGEAELLLPALLHAIAGGIGRAVPESRAEGLRLPSSRRRAGECDPGGSLAAALVDRICEASFPRRLGETVAGSAAVGVSNVWIRDTERGCVWQLEPGAAQVDDPIVDPSPREDELDTLCVYPWPDLEAGGWETLELYAQRGCAWRQCAFCSVVNRATRTMTPVATAETVAEAVQHGIKVVSFSDDMFVQRPRWTRELLQRLIELDLPVTLRAQTRVSPALWSLLDLMRRARFDELSLGVESLRPERVVKMHKAHNGQRYVEQARQSVLRVAQAGIPVVLFMIMVDPDSTLLQIAEELSEVVGLIDEVYERSGCVARLSYSLAMHPVTGAPMTDRYPHDCFEVDLGARKISLPSEFHFTPPIKAFLREVSLATAELPYRRENLSAFFSYLPTTARVADAWGDADAARIKACSEAATARLRALTERLDRDVDETVDELVRRATTCSEALEGPGSFRFDYQRFGGYIAGIDRFRRRLLQLLDGIEHGAKQGPRLGMLP